MLHVAYNNNNSNNNNRMINEWWIENGVEGMDHPLIWATLPTFAFKDWVIPRNTKNYWYLVLDSNPVPP